LTPCLPPVEPSVGCEIETEGGDEDELLDEDEELVGVGVGVGEADADEEDDVDEAVGVADATTGVEEEAAAGWWTAGFFAAA
jgi:hypothetical protein